MTTPRRIVFTREYNHRWPSRAMSCFKVTGEPITVKREVAEAAIAKGYAKPAPRGKVSAGGKTQHHAPGALDGRDTGARPGGVARPDGGVEHDVPTDGRDGLPGDPRA